MFGGSDENKESACNIGDPGSVPVLGRSPGEGNVPSLVFSPGDYQGQRSLAGGPWGFKDRTRLSN